MALSQRREEAAAGRAYGDPQAAPTAIAYYAALERSAQLVYHVTPMTGRRAPGRLSFDWSFDYYPLDYRLPGPELRIYRLRGRGCSGVANMIRAGN